VFEGFARDFDMANTQPSFLEDTRRFVFFGGKGGVGKTTSAVACAMHFAKRDPNRKILLVSTDPAHSLGDSLDQPIGDQTVAVRGIENLFAREADAERLLTEFKLKNGSILAKIADRGTYFDKDDIRSFVELSLPGMDEFMAILELMELARTGQYDVIVMDTAPTGHTIRLLELPRLLQQWVNILELMMKKHRFMAETFSRSRYRPDECDRWLETMACDAQRVERLLQDAVATEFVVVTIPEEMAVAESERLVAALKNFRIPVRNLIVNRVVERNGLCPFCRERCEEQAGALDRIGRDFADLQILRLPQLPCEVRGLESLRRFATLFVNDDRPGVAEHEGSPVPNATSETPRSGSTFVLPTARLVLIAGKGGVGKSTVAAATAIELAMRSPEKKVLIFSTDPAHSLSDSFGRKIGPKIAAIEGIPNLSAQEINAPQLLVDFKRRYRESIDEIFNSFFSDSGMKLDFDQAVMEQLLDLSPPGIDEVMALIEVMELMEEREFDIFVLDTAPTGHLIRFLEMPEIAGDRLGAAMQVISKYQGVVKLGAIASLVMRYSARVKMLRKEFLDAADTEIIVVTIPEAMAVVEMDRLLQALREFKIACRQIVVNLITPPSECPFCSMKRDEEQRYVRDILARHADHRIGCVPRLSQPVHGLTNLIEFKKIVWGDADDRSRKTSDIGLPSGIPGVPDQLALNASAGGCCTPGLPAN
jgi:arsenite/tail-anchored protein-transporting ATPase